MFIKSWCEVAIHYGSLMVIELWRPDLVGTDYALNLSSPKRFVQAGKWRRNFKGGTHVYSGKWYQHQL
jgi:hypothetical protein